MTIELRYRDATLSVEDRVSDLLARHPAEQVSDPLVDGKGGVLVALFCRHQPFTEPAVNPPTI